MTPLTKNKRVRTMQSCSAFIALYSEQNKSKIGASGCQPKIELTGNQSRSNIAQTRQGAVKHNSVSAISKRSLSTSANRINVIAKVSFKQNDSVSKKSLSATINYNLDRERGIDEQERSLFTSRLSDIDRSAAKEEIEKTFGEKIAFNKIILSSGDNHVNQKDFTRAVIAEWQKSLEKEFEYYAVEHRNTDYHHVHIIIPARTSAGQSDLSFSRENIASLREIGGDYLARDRFIDRDLDREIALEFGRDKLDKEVEKLFRISHKDYEREQTSLNLQTYKEMRTEQKELGLLFKYDPEQNSRLKDQSAEDYASIDKVSEEADSDSFAKEQSSHWDKDLSDIFYERNEDDRMPQNTEVEHDHSRKTRRQDDNDE